ncbi:ABC transporter permease [Natronococcus occultus]|uniref:ABC-type nitrate/sulfonate/bicarbonate transport system, permease component n=1 Tax=Natronococcus occultus SP4 TaxID=694430 RepID=L0JZ28_9EURY|nr:ABC transporter permease subunit [Natronococcus occultus]AGB37565.1 ABC-type nitrate/sulfonate/bicarbonate transport system, permease component [Natronococcus occultus SP4]
MSERTLRLAGGDVAYPAAALCVGVALWWGLAVLAEIPSFLLPTPDAVLARLAGNPELYLVNALHTLEKVVYGGAIGIAAGIVLAVFVASVPWFRRAVYPYLVTVRVLPKLAIAPLLLIYLGTGTATAIVFVALITFFPLVLNTAAGLDRTPSTHHDLLRSVRAGPIARLVYVDVPYAIPDVFAGLKQSVTLAVVGAVVAEWVVADSGLGFLILMGSENVRPDVMLAALAVLLVVGLALYGLVVLVQRRVHARLGLEDVA